MELNKIALAAGISTVVACGGAAALGASHMSGEENSVQPTEEQEKHGVEEQGKNKGPKGGSKTQQSAGKKTSTIPITPSPTTKFEDALVNYLNADGELQFKVSGYDSNTAISSHQNRGFPEIEVSVDVDSSLRGSEKGGNFLRDINGGHDWTWTAKMYFSWSGEEEKTTLNSADNEKFKALLEKLKATGSKEEKINFLKKCAKERTESINGKINDMDNLLKDKGVGSTFIPQNNKLSSNKTFHLVEKHGDSDNDLYFDTADKFFEK